MGICKIFTWILIDIIIKSFPLGAAADGLVIAGLSAFLPKFIQSQYKFTASLSSGIVGKDLNINSRINVLITLQIILLPLNLDIILCLVWTTAFLLASMIKKLFFLLCCRLRKHLFLVINILFLPCWNGKSMIDHSVMKSLIFFVFQIAVICLQGFWSSRQVA